MKVSECMSLDVRVASPDDTIQTAARIMDEIDAGVLPVGRTDRLVGMITDRDIAIRAVAKGKGPDATVAEIMTSEVQYCFVDDDANEVLRHMAETKVRRLPVLDHDMRLIGIVSLSDLAIGGDRPHLGEALERIVQPGGPHSQARH